MVTLPSGRRSWPATSTLSSAMRRVDDGCPWILLGIEALHYSVELCTVPVQVYSAKKPAMLATPFLARGLRFGYGFLSPIGLSDRVDRDGQWFILISYPQKEFQTWEWRVPGTDVLGSSGTTAHATRHGRLA